jgi:antitoxin component of MazEF toxin-antitoxin module
MAMQEITIVADAPALRLTQEMLDALGVQIGDDVEVSIAEQKLMVRAVSEAERDALVQKITEELFVQRRSAYEKLAEGAK